MKNTLTTVAVLALAGAASAQHSYAPAGPVTTADSIEVINLGDGAAAGTYNVANISGDYVDLSGSYSQEVLIGLDDGVTLNTYSGGFFGAFDGTNTSASGTFNWSIPLSGFAGGLGNDLFLNVANQFGSFNFTLSNINVTIDNIVLPTLASLSIGTLMDGDQATGNTNGSSNDLVTTSGNAFTGTGTAETGGDDVYELIWGGGDLNAWLNFESGLDLDLFLYDSADDLVDSAFTVANPEHLSVAGLAAGTYYLRVDGFFGDAGGYTLTLPAPGSVALLGLAGLAGLRRRRA